MSAVYEIKIPEKRGVFDHAATLVAGAAGVAAALIADFVQKGDSSAIYVLGVSINRGLDVEIPLGYFSLGLLIAGSLAVYIFEPKSKRGAFYTGAGVLAVLMTGMPVQELQQAFPALQGGVPVIEEEGPGGMVPLLEDETTDASPGNAAWRGNGADCLSGPQIMRASFSPVAKLDKRCADSGHQVIQAAAGGPLPIKVEVTVPNGELPRMSARLYDKLSGKTWDITATGRARRAGSGYVVTYALDIEAAAAGRGAVADIWVRVDADGYAVAETNKMVQNASQPVALALKLVKSDQPEFLKRLQTPYKY